MVEETFSDNMSDAITISRNSVQVDEQNFMKHDPFDSRSSNSSTEDGDLKSRKSSFSKDEEEKLGISLKDYYGMDLTALLETSFNSMTYRLDVCDIQLPSPIRLFSVKKWDNDKLSELQAIKHNLNSVKPNFDQYESLQWNRHTRSMNPSHKFMRHLKKDVDVEFLTRAGFSFYELINKYELIPADALSENKLSTFHLCEAPGAFVASLNHYLKRNHPNLEWSWGANSLNPYYHGQRLSETINDNRFMLQTIDNWDFGPDMTGNITQPEYPGHLYSKYDLYDEEFPHLITANGTFDCPDNLDEQESSISWFLLKEIINALSILRKNGNFVIRMLTFFESDTLCLLMLLAAAFEEIHVEKPATSKEDNSEVYVVCQRFRSDFGIEAHLHHLRGIGLQTYEKKSMFPFETGTESFFGEIMKCANHFASRQINVIERNRKIYQTNPNDPNLRKHRDLLQKKFAQHYIKEYNLHPIELKDDIVKLAKLEYKNEKRQFQLIESKYREEAYNADRIQKSALLVDDLLGKMFKELDAGILDKSILISNEQQLSMGHSIPIIDFDIKIGKCIEAVVRSSQFCHDRFMRMRNELINLYGIRKYNIVSTAPLIPSREFVRRHYDLSIPHMMYDCNHIRRETLIEIFVKLDNLPETKDFILIAFPLLTQFNVDIICVLRQMFALVSFQAPNQLTFYDMDRTMWNLWRPELLRLIEVNIPWRSIVSFLPVSSRPDPDDYFYEWLTDVNNCCLYHEINRVILLRPST